jgi:hypothetical protein
MATNVTSAFALCVARDACAFPRSGYSDAIEGVARLSKTHPAIRQPRRSNSPGQRFVQQVHAGIQTIPNRRRHLSRAREGSRTRARGDGKPEASTSTHSKTKV